MKGNCEAARRCSIRGRSFSYHFTNWINVEWNDGCARSARSPYASAAERHYRWRSKAIAAAQISTHNQWWIVCRRSTTFNAFGSFISGRQSNSDGCAVGRIVSLSYGFRTFRKISHIVFPKRTPLKNGEINFWIVSLLVVFKSSTLSWSCILSLPSSTPDDILTEISKTFPSKNQRRQNKSNRSAVHSVCILNSHF